ncbi:MAG: indole-3-glycerol-phosphate synthase [Promethearchaeota archaeon]
MISNKIKEIVEKRRKSLQKDLVFWNSIKDNNNNNKDNREPLSTAIKNNINISIISEIKPSSPILGVIQRNIDVPKIVFEMEQSGVIGLSILTEPNFFNGSYENLKIAINNTKIPCLMKDFFIDIIQYQIASKLGATNILLINSICNLEDSYCLAIEYDLEPLIEIHYLEEIQSIRHLFDIGLEPKLIGVNNRNLKNLNIDLKASKIIIPKLREEFGEKIQIISESGISSKKDIDDLFPYGIDAFLIGTSIMKSKNIKNKILELRGIK